MESDLFGMTIDSGSARPGYGQFRSQGQWYSPGISCLLTVTRPTR